MCHFKYFFCNANAKHVFYDEVESLHRRHFIFHRTPAFSCLEYRLMIYYTDDTILSVGKVPNIVDSSSDKLTRILTTVDNLL